jgi:hypothetical protein
MSRSTGIQPNTPAAPPYANVPNPFDPGKDIYSVYPTQSDRQGTGVLARP